MPTIGVCGDSYMSATLNGERADLRDSEGKHFTEILARKIGYTYFTLARCACSNMAIRFQIEEMINKNVDFVIIGTTRSDRLEYPAKRSLDSCVFESYKGIYNFVYDTHPDRSAQNSQFGSNNFYTETLTNVLAGNYGYSDCIDEDQRESLRRYFMDIYDHKYRELQDAMIIAEGIRCLNDAKIPYVIILHEFFPHVRFFKKHNIRHIVRDNEKFDQRLIPQTYNGLGSNRRWHTSDEDQVDIANLMCDYIKTNNLLVWS
jgi:hypothetical protein